MPSGDAAAADELNSAVSPLLKPRLNSAAVPSLAPSSLSKNKLCRRPLPRPLKASTRPARRSASTTATTSRTSRSRPASATATATHTRTRRVERTVCHIRMISSRHNNQEITAAAARTRTPVRRARLVAPAAAGLQGPARRRRGAREPDAVVVVVLAVVGRWRHLRCARWGVRGRRASPRRARRDGESSPPSWFPTPRRHLSPEHTRCRPPRPSRGATVAARTVIVVRDLTRCPP